MPDPKEPVHRTYHPPLTDSEPLSVKVSTTEGRVSIDEVRRVMEPLIGDTVIDKIVALARREHARFCGFDVGEDCASTCGAAEHNARVDALVASLRSASPAPAPDPGALAACVEALTYLAAQFSDFKARGVCAWCFSPGPEHGPTCPGRVIDAAIARARAPGRVVATIENALRASLLRVGELLRGERSLLLVASVESAAIAKQEAAMAYVAAEGTPGQDAAREAFQAAAEAFSDAVENLIGGPVACAEGMVTLHDADGTWISLDGDDGDVWLAAHGREALRSLPVGARVRVLVVEATGGEKGT